MEEGALEMEQNCMSVELIGRRDNTVVVNDVSFYLFQLHCHIFKMLFHLISPELLDRHVVSHMQIKILMLYFMQ